MATTSSGFSTDFKEQVRSRTNLVELIGESIALTARGSSDFVGLCPFHDDTNPSFHVYPDRQSYRCWVCEEGGDCFSFVMKHDRVGFREALEMLADRAGLEMPRTIGRTSPEQKDRKSRLYEYVSWAETLCHEFLLNDRAAAAAREYLQSRGYGPEIWRAFRLGYHPQDWQWLLEKSRLKKFPAEELKAAGLITQKQDGGGWRDEMLFFGRVLFPIRDLRERPVGFGGRILPKDDDGKFGKYINSSDSEVFAKSSLLYAFDMAREAIKDENTVAVMEGYTDCISAHQYGVRNVVASLGTALNENHVRNLKRFAQKVVLVFDGDKAGQQATERAITKFLAEDVDLRILTLPGGLDPADFVSQHGGEALKDRIANAAEAWEYKLNSCVERIGVSSVDAKQRVLAEMATALAQSPRLSGSARESLIVARLAGLLMIDERTIRETLNTTRSQGGNQRPTRISHSQTQPKPLRVDWNNPDDVIECELLEMIFAVPSIVFRLQQEIGPEAVANLALRQLLQLCYDLAEQGDEPSFSLVSTALEDPELKRLAIRIDDHARQKRIDRLLQEAKPFITNNGKRTTHADYVIDQLKLRYERQNQEPLKGRLTGLVAGESPDSPVEAARPVDRSEQLRLLEKVQKYHARRANS
ncbi:DNA primase [Thalassoroseus pseudoceratinae]|uniref:DNA primase n=1 Tax=Thalassoroseus pseudoceratinae TaxID=2713176 RepID=UPI001423F5E7|nr:DNA primase [Thalassoroseus pseudoceratinae]